MTLKKRNLIRDLLFLMIASALFATLFECDMTSGSKTCSQTVVTSKEQTTQGLSTPKLVVCGLELGMPLQEAREVAHLNGWSISRADDDFIQFSPDFIPLQHQMGDQIRVNIAHKQTISGIEISSAQCAEILIDGERIYGFKSNSVLAVFEKIGKPQSVSSTEEGWPIYTWSRWNLQITEAPYQRTISRVQLGKQS